MIFERNSWNLKLTEQVKQMSKFKKDIYHKIMIRFFCEIDGNNVDENGLVVQKYFIDAREYISNELSHIEVRA